MDSYNKSQLDALLLNFILVKNSAGFGQTYCPSSGVLVLYSQQLVFVILVMLTVCQQTVNITSMTNTYCCEYSIKTPDDGKLFCPKHVEFFIKMKFEKWCIFLALIPYPTAFPYGNGMVLHFYQQQESSTTKTVHKVINKGLKAYVQSLHSGENFH